MTSPIWQRLLPSDIAVADADPAADPPPLLRSEQSLVTGAAAARRREVAWGRACGRRALRLLDSPDVPILRGDQRQPLWPAGYVGSISHCRDYVVAAVGRLRSCLSVGVDVEPLDSRIGPGIVALIAADDEREWLAGEPPSTALIVFSAKESFYKAWFPLTGVWLDFRDVVVSFTRDTGSFAVSVPDVAQAYSPEQWRHAGGRYAVEAGRVHTAYVVRPVA